MCCPWMFLYFNKLLILQLWCVHIMIKILLRLQVYSILILFVLCAMLIYFGSVRLLQFNVGFFKSTQNLVDDLASDLSYSCTYTSAPE